MIPINRESDPRWQQLGEYVRAIADKMGLTQHFLNISHEAPENNTAIAETFVVYEGLEATLRFNDSFFVSCQEKQRLTVVHELLHVMEAALIAVVASMKEHTPPALDRMETLEHERFIDWSASLIAPRFPLPNITADEQPAESE